MDQHAPRLGTIVLGLLLVLVGVAGTFLRLIPNVAGIPGETIGVAAYVGAEIVLLAGVFIRGL